MVLVPPGQARSDATYWREGLNGALMTDALTERMEVAVLTRVPGRRGGRGGG